MNIVVLLKQTFDTEAKIVLKDGKVDSTEVTQVINPYDEFAIEEALKIKEANGGEGEVVIVSVGGAKTEEAIRTGLAMGCDRAILINDPDAADPDSWAAAEILAKALADVSYDLILSGRIAVDDQQSQVAVRVAEILGIPSVTSILELNIADGKATATREIDGGKEIIEVPLPAVFTAQKGLNEPRYPNMMGIMKAKKKELLTKTFSDIGGSASDLAPKMAVRSASLPAARAAGTILKGEAAETAAELARLLREEAKVI